MVRSMHESAQQKATPFITRPKARMVRLYRLAAVGLTTVALVAILFTIVSMPPDIFRLPSTWIAGIGGALALLFFFLYVQRRSVIYTVTPEFVAAEADMGIFGRYSRRIPVAYIRDVTSRMDVIDRFNDVGSVTVSATNGDSITFEDIADPETAREVIWQLVERAAGR